MLKVKKWLYDVERKESLIDKSKYKFRLDQSERVDDFSNKFFNDFLKNIKQTDFITYPYLYELKNKIASHNDVNVNNIFITPGSDMAIKTMFEICVTSDSEVLSTAPSFPMYSVYSSIHNGIFKTIQYDEDLTYSIDYLCSMVNDKTSLVILANPNSPIGDYKTEEELKPILELTNKLQIPLLIDEAYVEFSPGTLKHLVFKYNNVCVSRTFSKAWGAAGIRLGYLIGDKDIMNVINKCRIMYEVTGITAKFGCYLLENVNEIVNYRDSIIREKEILCDKLIESGFDVVSSHANWIHFNDNDNNQIATNILNDRKDISYKGCTEIPYDDRDNWIRLTIGQNLHKEDFMKEIING